MGTRNVRTDEVGAGAEAVEVGGVVVAGARSFRWDRRVQVLATATAVLTVAAAAALVTRPDERAVRTVEASGTPTTVTHGEDPTTTTAAPTTTLAPPPVGTPAPAPAPVRTVAEKQRKPATSSAPASGAYPGSVAFPFQAGRSAWSGVSNELHMAISVDNPRPKAGEPVTFTMTLTHATRRCCAFALTYGDGGPFFTQSANECPAQGASAPGTVTATATRAYNKAGRWRFTFTGMDRDCGMDASSRLHGYLYAWIEVAPGGPPTSQGPSLPTFRSADRYGPTQYDNDPSWVTVYAAAEDIDGYVAKLVVDYGDGATETFLEKDRGCRQAANGWPEQSFLSTPTSPPPAHQYAAKGTYTVTITAYSQACDGGAVQQAARSFTHTYP